MATRWELWNAEFHAELFQDDITCVESTEEKALPCRNCIGRGNRPRPNLMDLKLPLAATIGNWLEDSSSTASSRRVGKGRAQVMRERAMKMKSRPGHSAAMQRSGSRCSSEDGFSFTAPSSDAGRMSVEETLLDCEKQLESMIPKTKSSKKSSLRGANSPAAVHTIPASFSLRPNVKPNGIFQGFSRLNGGGANLTEPLNPYDLKQDFPDLPSPAGSMKNSAVTNMLSVRSGASGSTARSADASAAQSLSEEALGGACVIVVDNLPKDCSEELLLDIFAAYGQVEGCRLESHGANSMRGYLQMGSAEECKWACSLDGEQGLFSAERKIRVHMRDP